ncbi:ribosome-associated ATPase/putative transporter RbbA [Nisaea nitritireducens]|uniref:ribosome-associated ATPase/putative transporter RbbA n=1 Tax=Nisaea nitritireducens TaxID=568392 RepID=UPI0018693897|nr:ribosome-associated ATPase/putative transporter RbbA [Nisaea nitritireducens]
MTDAALPIRFSGVSHRYGRTDALREIDLEIPSGSTVAVIGPDGVGKSTLLALLSGTKRIQSGTVEALGGDLRRKGHRRRVCGRIAYMPQGLGKNLYPTLSIAENIDFFARLYDQPEAERQQRANELLQATGLAPFRDRPAAKLSGGMKQKLALCCALVHDPDLLILDEPTTGVDPLSRRQFWDLIARIQGRRPWMTIVTATAYMSEAERFEHLIAMHDGTILAEGTAEELKEQAGADSLEDAFLALLPENSGTGFIPRPKPENVGQSGEAPAIEAAGLIMQFGDFTAVDHVDFRIERGEIFGFLGSNGCGKTTTMKMLTGLLTPTEGEARIFGKRIESDGMEMRRRVGYMSQSFSLYGELTVHQNLDLHADLFQITGSRKTERVAELADRFGLAAVMNKRPNALPLGIRQRLQLAVAVLHRPEMLILDEPTSGVDPVARDGFWNLLTELSREDGVTIFISTHFMNEAERCDRISLMHAGRVLAMGPPDELVAESGRETLEETFIDHLELAAKDGAPPVEEPAIGLENTNAEDMVPALFSPARLWAVARRETYELSRDPIRLAFAIFGPLILMLSMGYGISFDVEDMRYAALDQDRSHESRMVLRQFEGSRYFSAAPELRDTVDLDRRMQRGEISLALVLPPGFGRDLVAGRQPEVSAWLDGANTSRAETSRGYVEGAFSSFLSEFAALNGTDTTTQQATDIEVRFRYNQGFTSQQAIPPGVLMMLMMMIPSMLTALGIVREKELGSITNLYASPASRFEFLVGKQLPYIGIALISFCTMMLMMFLLFDLAPKSSVLVLLAGAVLYATAATGFGLLASTVATSQVAAVFGTAIIVLVPTINFSGMLHPVATLDTAGRILGEAFPSSYFQKISSGVFNKGLPVADLAPNLAMLAIFCVAYWAISSVALPKQDR